MIDGVPSLTPGGLSRTPKKEMHDMLVDTAVIYCITSLREQTFVANYCTKSSTPTSPSQSPIHSCNIVIEAAATIPEFTVVLFLLLLIHCIACIVNTTELNFTSQPSAK